MYQIIILPEAQKSFKKIDKEIQSRVVQKIDWLSENANQIIHHQLSNLPDDLKGLCKERSGDYRILYWIYHEKCLIKIYNIEHRRTAYRSL